MRLDLATTADDVDAAELWPVYDAVFGDQPDQETWRAAVWDRHRTRDGFRLVRAHDDAGLAGFAYGYTGQRGQWWTDRVAEVWPAELADTWLGGHFELVSIGVLERTLRTGVGASLLRTLTDGLPQERWLLMTSADPQDPARRLYARAGWTVVGPGLAADRVVLGRLRTSGR